MIFAIPGTPKDFLTYIIGLTHISIPMYILLTFFARIPSVITSTFMGASIGDGKLMQAVIILSVTAVISGIGYLVYQGIQKKLLELGFVEDDYIKETKRRTLQHRKT